MSMHDVSGHHSHLHRERGWRGSTFATARATDPHVPLTVGGMEPMSLSCQWARLAGTGANSCADCRVCDTVRVLPASMRARSRPARDVVRCSLGCRGGRCVGRSHPARSRGSDPGADTRPPGRGDFPRAAIAAVRPSRFRVERDSSHATGALRARLEKTGQFEGGVGALRRPGAVETVRVHPLCGHDQPERLPRRREAGLPEGGHCAQPTSPVDAARYDDFRSACAAC